MGSPTTGQTSLAGQSFTLDGVSDYLQATSVNAPDGDFSIVAVANPSALGINKRIVVQYGLSDPSPTYHGVGLQMEDDGMMRAFFEDGTDVRADSTTTLIAGEWTPVGLTWAQSSGTGRVYVNGVGEGSATGGQVLFATTNFETGRHPQFNARYWSGGVDEVALWNSLLDEDQMATLAWLFRRGVTIKSWIGF